MYKMEWSFFQSYAAVSSDVLPIQYSVDLQKFIPFCVPVSCEILPTLCFSGLGGFAQSFSIDWWSSFHLMLQHSVMIFHPLFQWALKYFLIPCSIELWSSSHPVFWAVKFFHPLFQLAVKFFHLLFQLAVTFFSFSFPVSCRARIQLSVS